MGQKKVLATYFLDIQSQPLAMAKFAQGSNSAFIIFASFVWTQLLKERICSFRSKFFPLRADPFLKGIITQGTRLEVIKVIMMVYGYMLKS